MLRCVAAIFDDDPRLGEAIRALRETTGVEGLSLKDIATTAANGYIDPRQIDSALQQIQKLRDRICELETHSLEDELVGLVVSVLPKGVKSQPEVLRYVTIVCRRFGWDGLDSDTLQKVGDMHGITRERVRQITSQCRRKLSDAKYPFAPRLDEAIVLINHNVPAVAQTLEDRLVESGITENQFRLEGLIDVAAALGRPVQFHLSDTGKFVFQTSDEETLDDDRMAKIVRQTARKSVGRWGATTIADLAVRVEEALSTPIDIKLIVAILEDQEDFRWLDAASGWFWLTSVPERRNRLLNYIRKMLSVVERIDVSDLRAGVSRHHRMSGVSPPKRVLLELCRQVDGYRVEGATVIADPPLDWGRVLAETEATMALVLIEHGPIMQRAQFEEICLSLGVNRTTFYIYLDNSPIIARYARGVYGLPGAAASPDLIESLIPDQSRGKRLMDYGWTDDGQIWIAYKLSVTTIASGVITIPGSMKHLISGTFDLLSVDDSPVGQLVVKDHAAWGLGPYFRRRGGEPDDLLTVIFDLTRREAHVAIGNEDSLQDYIVP